MSLDPVLPALLDLKLTDADDHRRTTTRTRTRRCTCRRH